MATAKRELILSALATRIGATRNPYPDAYDLVPMLALLEGDESVTARDYDDEVVTLSIVIEAIDRYDEDAERTTAANALLASTIVACYGTDRTMSGLCETIRYTGGSTLFSESGSALVGAVARFEIDYLHVAGSPY